MIVLDIEHVEEGNEKIFTERHRKTERRGLGEGDEDGEGVAVGHRAAHVLHLAGAPTTGDLHFASKQLAIIFVLGESPPPSFVRE